VIGGWFFTAFIAFSASFLIATLIFFGKLPAMLILIALAIFILVRTHAFHRKRTEKADPLQSEIITASYEVLKSCDDEVKSTVIKTSKILYLTYINLFKEKFKEMKGLKKDAKRLNKKVKEIRANLPDTLKKFEETEIDSGHHYVQVVDYLKEMVTSLTYIVQPAFNHLDNNHPLDKEQSDTFKEFNDKTSEFFNYIINLLKNRNFENMDELNQQRDEILDMINNIVVSRIKILKKTKKGVKVSVTYLEMLSETKNLILHAVQLAKADIRLQESLSTETPRYIEEDILD